MTLALLALGSAAATTPDRGDSLLNDADGRFNVAAVAELGTLAPLAHTIQFSTDGTGIDLVRDGGQDNLVFFQRYALEADLGARNTVVLLYQPLRLRTEAVWDRAVRIDGLDFPRDTAVDVLYGFDFYRASWLWDTQRSPDRELAVGLSLQIRNAEISFTSSDGSLRRTNHDLGPVPVLKLRSRTPVGDAGAWVGVEADGFYAPIKYLNGGEVDVVGAILDASVRVGRPLAHGTEGFLNLRYLGGGAEGTGDPGPYGDGFVRNWLHFTSLSAGVAVR
jgi:hypothetical protein